MTRKKLSPEGGLPESDANLPSAEREAENAARDIFISQLKTTTDFFTEQGEKEFTPALIEEQGQLLRIRADEFVRNSHGRERNEVLLEVINRFQKTNNLSNSVMDKIKLELQIDI